MAEAEAAFRAALRLQPNYAAAHSRLATLLRGKLPDADLAALEERLADPKLEPGPRGRLLFALAHVLDSRGEFARAADCLRQANAVTLEQDKGRRDVRAGRPRAIRRPLAPGVQRRLVRKVRGSGLETRRPVFVFGLPRSGTTLIEQVLASHPRIHGAGELRLARQSFEAIPTVLDRSDPPNDCVPALDAAAAAPAGRRAPGQARRPGRRPARADRRQDARQLHVSRPACPDVPPRRLHPQPPRPPRRGRIVLDDRLPLDPLGQRPRRTSPAGSSNTGG